MKCRNMLTNLKYIYMKSLEHKKFKLITLLTNIITLLLEVLFTEHQFQVHFVQENNKFCDCISIPMSDMEI